MNFTRSIIAGTSVVGLLSLVACSTGPAGMSGPSDPTDADSAGSAPTSVASDPVAAVAPLAPQSPAVTDAAAVTNAATAPGTATAAKKSLFTGAVYSRKARSKPSAGGVALRTTGAGPLRGRTVVIDAGHNGRSEPRINNRKVPDGRGGTKACNTTGTSTNAGYAEHRHNWAVATLAAERLQNLGARVVLTRPDNAGVGPCVDERAAIGNRFKADVVVSIHADGAAARARGFHVIRSTGMAGGSTTEKQSAQLAVLVRDAYAKRTGLPRSTYLGKGTGITPRGDIAGLNLSRVPAVMLEAGNMRNPTEARLLSTGTFHAKEADAVVDGIRAFLRR